jgi:DNA-binding transcriptional MerR regulator
MDATYSMAQACRRTGISAHTLRYSERAGLLKHPLRSAGGRRVYRERDLQWLEMLRVLRGTGMSIRRIRALAAMVEQGDASLEARIAFFRDWQAEIARQIEARRLALETLERKVARHAALLAVRDAHGGTDARTPPCLTKP